MQEGTLFEMDTRKTLHAFAPAPGHPEQPAVHLHGNKHGSTASAPSHLPDPMDEEIAALQKRNQLIELQQRHSQLMANANLEQGSMRAIPGSNKYPVM